MDRPPLPPFTLETATQKVRMAEDAWNTRDPARVALAYTTTSRWRNRAEFVEGREAIEAFLRRKWDRELDYRLIKQVWAFHENRIAVRFAYESHASMTPRSRKPIANTTGRSAAARTITRRSAISGSEDCAFAYPVEEKI